MTGVVVRYFDFPSAVGVAPSAIAGETPALRSGALLVAFGDGGDDAMKSN